MASVALEPASTLSPAELAAVFTAGYEGYFMPVAVDEAAYGFMVRSWDVELEASRVAFDGEQPVGICNLAVRGEEGWIGGVGVVTERRGQGIGELLMRAAEEEARARGLKRIWLEVLVQNEPAIRLYEKLGYEQVRDLDVWSLDELALNQHKLPPATVAEALARTGGEREPWQRADASVAKLEDAQAVSSERGAMIFRGAGRVSILQLAAEDDDAVRELIGSLPADTTAVQLLNLPAGGPVGGTLESLGGTVSARQHELVLEL